LCKYFDTGKKEHCNHDDDKSVFHGIFVTSASVCDELVLGLALPGARSVGP
jgi:hypothetical protein